MEADFLSAVCAKWQIMLAGESESAWSLGILRWIQAEPAFLRHEYFLRLNHADNSTELWVRVKQAVGLLRNVLVAGKGRGKKLCGRPIYFNSFSLRTQWTEFAYIELYPDVAAQRQAPLLLNFIGRPSGFI